MMDTIPMKRKRISPIQDALYWCRAKRDKDGFVIKFINNFIAMVKDYPCPGDKRYKGSEEIGNGPKYEIVSEKNTATLVVHKTKLSDAAVYKCMAANPHGQVNVVKIEVGNSLEVLNNLNTTEKCLESRKVPVLLTEECKKVYKQMLIKLRENPAVQPKRDYFFARPLDAKSPFYGNVAIRKPTMLCGAKQPELMTSTGLRKQQRTMCLVLSLSEQQKDILANFMGHDLQVHREFYRLPENYFESNQDPSCYQQWEDFRI
ncbi:hypothetical protein KUTeg_020571 [Tegillarca granosa]|uniref:Immunoglobulin I-set domain-containing protein n=1 Tax=Tegillarca granosa TaxID=220873 RepID=A0ABQ9E8B4_TEGGR|nr:hypothetical protein KUTeg_020571 [Tegillarca granosa]